VIGRIKNMEIEKKKNMKKIKKSELNIMLFKKLDRQTKDLDKEITKSIKMKGKTAKKLKLASSIAGKKQGELVDLLLDYYLDQVYENELKESVKKLKKGKISVIDINGNNTTVPELNK
jgi:hypothetical protein